MLTSYSAIKNIDWLWQQTPHSFGHWDNIQMLAKHPKPDFLLMYQFDFPEPPQPQPWFKNLRQKQAEMPVDVNSLLRGVPQERIIYLLREPP